MKRLTIALDVARGVEYLHSLAHQSFIHRDLKPSNILLTDDMRAKVADFGIVRLAPDGKSSVLTKLAGTFGYLAPEYAVTGRVTVEIDVFSFGVILLQLITEEKRYFNLSPNTMSALILSHGSVEYVSTKTHSKRPSTQQLILMKKHLLASTLLLSWLVNVVQRNPYRGPTWPM
ncbi:unnamed protein product [Camellia sinensis]